MTTTADAACRPHVAAGNDYWHEPGRETPREKTWREQMAKAICSTCPVRAACAAAVTDDDHGIWAGATLPERNPGSCAEARGTTAGYGRHRRRHEPPCDQCMDAWRAYSSAYARQQQAKEAT